MSLLIYRLLNLRADNYYMVWCHILLPGSLHTKNPKLPLAHEYLHRFKLTDWRVQRMVLGPRLVSQCFILMQVRDVRLPTWLMPVHYIIDMKPDIYQTDPEDFTNTGTVMIQMECKEATKTVTIHANKLEVTPKGMVDSCKLFDYTFIS